MKTIIGCGGPAPIGEYSFDVDFDYGILCPRCGHIYHNDDDEYQFADYVSTTEFLKEMLWCDKCDSRFVIDDYTDSEIISKEDAVETYPKLFKDSNSTEFEYFYEVTFAKIVQVVDNSLTSFQC